MSGTSSFPLTEVSTIPTDDMVTHACSPAQQARAQHEHAQIMFVPRAQCRNVRSLAKKSLGSSGPAVASCWPARKGSTDIVLAATHASAPLV
jgi:hypothetical protein